MRYARDVSDLVFATGPVHLDEDGDDLRADLSTALSDHLGLSVEVRTSPTYADLANAIERGEAHLAWLPPALFVRAYDGGAVAEVLRTVRGVGGTYQGALFVAASGSRKTPASLRGTRVAWVDRDSCAGYLFPRLALRRAGFDPSALFADEFFVGSHAAAVRAVQTGKADVAATYVQLADSNDAKSEQLLVGWVPYVEADAMRSVLVSPSIPSDAVVITRATSPGSEALVLSALEEAGQHPKVAPLLRALLGAEALERTDPAFYGSVREAMEGSR